MRFISLVKGPEGFGMPPKALMDAIDKLAAELGPALVETGGLAPSRAGALVRIRNGKVSVTDGPFIETKEVVGGFAIMEFPTREEAIAWTERFMQLHVEHFPGWEGVTELRQMMGPEDFAAMMG